MTNYTYEWISPEEINTPHEVMEEEKVIEMVKIIEEDGYNFRPILVIEHEYGYMALTGVHRIAAAIEAGVNIKAHVAELKDGLVDRVNMSDDEYRLESLMELLEEGIIDEEAVELMREEIN